MSDQIQIFRHNRGYYTYFAEKCVVEEGYIVCRTPRKMLIDQNIIALPWQELTEII